jgi:transcriptional regulator CtsR
MSQLSDTIEAFIVAMLKEEDRAELKRNQLAAEFQCAPSQINYVLSTRFTSQRGYIVESRRGGGGYIRIMRMNDDKGLLYDAATHPPATLTFETGTALLARMVQIEAVTMEQASMMRAAISDAALGNVDWQQRDAVRARVFHAMLVALVR